MAGNEAATTCCPDTGTLDHVCWQLSVIDTSVTPVGGVISKFRTPYVPVITRIVGAWVQEGGGGGGLGLGEGHGELGLGGGLQKSKSKWKYTVKARKTTDIRNDEPKTTKQKITYVAEAVGGVK